MDFKAIVIAHLPKKAGETITYGELRKRTQIRRGMCDVLDDLESDGEVSFSLDAAGQVVDDTIITVHTTALRLEDFMAADTTMTGHEIAAQFRFNPDRCNVRMFPSRTLRITEPRRGTIVSVVISPGKWRPVPTQPELHSVS